MDSSKVIEKDELHDWIENETRALDVVASWETLCDVYHTLEFNDPISDSMKLEEFKWIIENMNRFLTSARKKLHNCTNPESMKETLSRMFTSEQAKVSDRRSLTYHKLRQMWVNRMIMTLDTKMLREENEDGRDYWND